jgi:RNA polymerase sigma-70 factor, ECF subfamily
MPHADDTQSLVSLAVGGDSLAWNELLTRHRSRLRRMIAVRMNPKLTARMDPSDVIQEVVAEAARQLPSYARRRPLPFYPWLRQLAWDRLVKLHQRHLRTEKRSVAREEPACFGLPDQSAVSLAKRLVAGGTSPSGRALREELCGRVHRALDQLEPGDREILIMRHLEQLQVAEIAALLGISEGAVKMRRLRAAERMRELLESDGSREDLP